MLKRRCLCGKSAVRNPHCVSLELVYEIYSGAGNGPRHRCPAQAGAGVPAGLTNKAEKRALPEKKW